MEMSDGGGLGDWVKGPNKHKLVVTKQSQEYKLQNKEYNQ